MLATLCASRSGFSRSEESVGACAGEWVVDEFDTVVMVSLAATHAHPPVVQMLEVSRHWVDGQPSPWFAHHSSAERHPFVSARRRCVPLLQGCALDMAPAHEIRPRFCV